MPLIIDVSIKNLVIIIRFSYFAISFWVKLNILNRNLTPFIRSLSNISLLFTTIISAIS